MRCNKQQHKSNPRLLPSFVKTGVGNSNSKHDGGRCSSTRQKAVFLAMASLALICLQGIYAPEITIEPRLFGIGYYEAQAFYGVNGVSFAGGTEIVFYG